MRRYLAEAFGTFMLVLVGTGAIVLDARSGGALGAAGVSLAFGVIVTLMILLLARVSGAHINPAVSLGFWLAGRLEVADLAAYVFGQMLGALAASAALVLLFADSATYGATKSFDPASKSQTMFKAA